MTKIYEALENAERGKAVAGGAGMPKRASVSKTMESILLSLYQRIDSAAATGGAKIVGIANAQAGNDSAILLCEVAKLAALRLSKRVLVVATGPASHVCRIFSMPGAKGWEAVVNGGESVHGALHTVSDSLAVTQLTTSESGVPAVLSSRGFKSTLDQLRGEFDLILVDAPSLANAADLVLLSASIDGVVIVVEAGKSRLPAVRYGVDQINAQGGNVLGVVLNRRRFHIPGFLYNRL